NGGNEEQPRRGGSPGEGRSRQPDSVRSRTNRGQLFIQQRPEIALRLGGAPRGRLDRNSLAQRYGGPAYARRRQPSACCAGGQRPSPVSLSSFCRRNSRLRAQEQNDEV